MSKNLLKKKDIAVYDLIKTFDGIIGVVTKIKERGIILKTIDDEKKILLKDIKAIRYVTPKCFRHGNRFCNLCHQNSKDYI